MVECRRSFLVRQLIEIVGPCLCRLVALFNEPVSIVGFAELLVRDVGRVLCGHAPVPVPAQAFPNERSRHGPETVPGDVGLGVVAQAAQGTVHRVVRDIAGATFLALSARYAF